MTAFRKYSMPVMLSAILMGGSVTAFAWPGGECYDDGPHKGGYHGMEYGGKKGHFGDMMGDKLGLSDDQKNQVKQIMESARAEGEPLREAHKAARQAEREAIQAGADEATLRKLATDTANTRVDMMLHHQAVRERVDAVLTDEQRQKMADMREQRMEKMEERREKFRDRPGE